MDKNKNNKYNIGINNIAVNIKIKYNFRSQCKNKRTINIPIS